MHLIFNFSSVFWALAHLQERLIGWESLVCWSNLATSGKTRSDVSHEIPHTFHTNPRKYNKLTRIHGYSRHSTHVGFEKSAIRKDPNLPYSILTPWLFTWIIGPWKTILISDGKGNAWRFPSPIHAHQSSVSERHHADRYTGSEIRMWRGEWVIGRDFLWNHVRRIKLNLFEDRRMVFSATV